MKSKDTIARSSATGGFLESVTLYLRKSLPFVCFGVPSCYIPPITIYTTERICAPLCQQVPYCTLSAKTEWLIPPGANKTISLPWPVAYHTEQNMVVCNVLLAPGAHSQLAISARLEQCIIISNSMKRNSNVGTYLYRGLYAAR